MQIKPQTPETWRPIPGFDGNYDVSDCGRIWSNLTQKILATAKNPRGYVHIPLRVRLGEKKSFDVHRLMALAFIGEPGSLTVNHKNGDKGDNRLENLEYVTRSENQRHALDKLGFQPRFGERHPHAKLTVSDVVNIRMRAAAGVTLIKLAEEYKRSTGGICDIVSGKAWRHAPGPIRPI